MLISVVIPTYNRALELNRAVDSVTKQTYTKWEIIVIDNYSEDNTDEIIKSYKNYNINLLKIHNNGNIAKSRNAGILSAKGELIAFLDSDDYWDENKLEYSIRYFNTKRADLTFHKMHIKGPKKNLLYCKKTVCRNLRKPVYDDLLTNGNIICNSSVVVKKQLLLKIGLISQDQNKLYWEDYDTWIRISNLTNNFVYIPRTLGTVTKHATNMLQDSIIMKNTKDICTIYKLNKYGNTKAWWPYYVLAKIQLNKKNYVKSFAYIKKIQKCPFKYKIKLLLYRIIIIYHNGLERIVY